MKEKYFINVNTGFIWTLEEIKNTCNQFLDESDFTSLEAYVKCCLEDFKEIDPTQDQLDKFS